MDVAFEGAHMIWDGVLCCTADDPEAYYAADARRVLELFVLAAEQGLELKADTLLAAAGAAPGVRSLSGRAAVQRHSGFALRRTRGTGRFVRRRAYASFGLPQRAPVCMAWRRRPPCLWRGGGCICGGGDIRRADASLCAALELDAALPELMAALDVLAAANTARGPAGAEACAEPPAGGAGL
ncbi:MAG: hypothetical protein ACLRZH_03505 [Ruthenibacterium lactatiformans]